MVSQTKVLTEQIVALQPDLILAGGNGLTPPEDIAHLRDLGYPVVVLYPETVDEVLGDITLIGDALGGDAAATAKETVDHDGHRHRDHQRVWPTADQLAPARCTRSTTVPTCTRPHPTPSSPTWWSSAGGDPVTTSDPAVFSLPTEQLLVADPAVIVLGDALYGTCPDAVAARPGWDAIAAVRTAPSAPSTTRSSPDPVRVSPTGLASLTRAIHPELADQLAEFPADPPMCVVSTSPAPSPRPPARRPDPAR